MTAAEPSYLTLFHNGELEKRLRAAEERLSHCDLCAQACLVDRHSAKLGVCRTGETARVSSFAPHFGEEKPLIGWRGSGAIFFCRCNLRCQFCQNFDISRPDAAGVEMSPQRLAAVMLELQEAGCHNINLVSPSHVVAQILAALVIAVENGLRLPLVYNTGGYDSLTTLQLLEGVIDIYMPDMKYANPQVGLHYSKARNYPQANQAAVREMHRQVGDLLIDENGIAWHGLLVRHLVLPNGLAGTGQITRFLAEELSPNTYLNLMDQYRPLYNARLYPQINRQIKRQEYLQAIDMAHEAGLQRLD